MTKRLLILVEYYLFWVLLFVLQKPLFMLLQHGSMGSIKTSDWLMVMLHGLPLDLSCAGYASVLFGLLLAASCYLPNKLTQRIAAVYTGLLLAVASLALVVDEALFPYWGFHPDRTLFIYLRTPADAMASVDLLSAVTGLAGLAAAFAATFCTYRCLFSKQLANLPIARRALPVLALTLATALLFLPIRGSLSVSTMNTGRVYFSPNPMLNTAAVNPLFNLIESLSDNTIATSKYTYMSREEKENIVREMLSTNSATRHSRLKITRPKEIILVIMESFSANAIDALRGSEGATPCINRLADEGILFTNAYASSFRTDRGVVAIMSGFPGQPTSSLMTIPNKSRHLPFASAELARAGYTPHFYYGGDEDFTNMRSYLMAGGITDRVSDKSFPREARRSKWGAHDHLVLDRAAESILSRQDSSRHLDIILTLSSHEPFEVPANQRFAHPYLNSIAYTDSAIGAFTDQLKAAGRWDSTLLVLVSDHGYRYPDTVSQYGIDRYRILMMLGGGVVKQPERVETICQQTDLLPTLLDEMGLTWPQIDTTPLCRNIFQAKNEWAFFSYNDGFVLLTPSDTCRIDGKTGICERGDETTQRQARAYMQHIYETIEKL